MSTLLRWALTASEWLMKKKPGLYSMRDLLNYS